MTANCVRAAMTARPMTMMMTGQKRHASWAISGSMAPAWTASATTPAVMSVTPQKMSPVLILTAEGLLIGPATVPARPSIVHRIGAVGQTT